MPKLMCKFINSDNIINTTLLKMNAPVSHSHNHTIEEENKHLNTDVFKAFRTFGTPSSLFLRKLPNVISVLARRSNTSLVSVQWGNSSAFLKRAEAVCKGEGHDFVFKGNV